MEKLNTEDGQLFVKSLARFVRTHEKALANAMQMRRQSRSVDLSSAQSNSASSASTLAAALSLGNLSLTSHSVRPARLTLTPHHLFYLLSRFEDLAVPVGPLNIRLENISNETSSAYVSFLSKPQRPRGAGGVGGDRDSIHSVSSVRSVMSTMSSFWSSFGLGSRDSVSKSDKAKAALETDLKYLYSAFTKIPCLRLAPDHRARLISGYEEFPFDTAVPLHSFKNLSALEIIDVDFRSFFGWDRLAEQLRSLTLKRAHLEDIGDLLTGIVLDDIDRRRRRSSKSQLSPVLGWPSNGSSVATPELGKSISAPGSPVVEPVFGTSASPKGSSSSMLRTDSSEGGRRRHARTGSISPSRPASSNKLGPGARHHHSHSYHHPYPRGSSSKIKRSGSGSSDSSESSSTVYRDRGISGLMAGGGGGGYGGGGGGATTLSPFKWRFLRHLNLTDNSLTSVSVASLAPVANTLHSLDLSWNLFTEVPDSLASLVALRSLNLSHCMIDSLHSLSRSPLPAITSLNLRGNRLRSIAGIERLLSLERLDLRDNAITDPVEIARLTAIPYIREIWISGNPFTRSHPGHRVTIFNLFRQTPGYPEDVFIDNTAPSYSERKQLVERAAEPEAAPVIRAFEQEAANEPAEASVSAAVDQELLSPSKETHVVKHRAPADVVSSPRRKKAHRKRVANLTDEPRDPVAPPVASAEHEFPDATVVAHQAVPDPFVDQPKVKADQPRPAYEEPISPTTAVVPSAAAEAQTVVPSTSSAAAAAAAAISPSTAEIDAEPTKNRTLLPAIDNIDWDVSGDIYRQRLEALKHEVGTNWLTVLGDDNWTNGANSIAIHSSPTDFHAAANPIRPPPPIARTSSQIIATGGREI